MDYSRHSTPDLYFVVLDHKVAARRAKPDPSGVLGTSSSREGAVEVAISTLEELGQNRFGMKLAIIGLSRSDANVWIDGGLVFANESGAI